MPTSKNDRRQSAGKLMDRLGASAQGEHKQLVLGDLVELDEVAELVTNIMEQGGAVMFSRTSDGGALSVTVFLDDQRVRKYLAFREQWLALLEMTRQ